MPHFYRLVLFCCKSSTDFLQGWMGHSNSVWAHEQFCLLSTKYPDVSHVLGLILVYCLDSHPPLPSGAVRSFRQRVLESVFKNMPHCPEGCMLTLTR